MKKYISQEFIAALVISLFVLLILASCEKCVECTTEMTTIVRNKNTGYQVGDPQRFTIYSTECGTKNQIEEIEGTTTAITTQGIYTSTTTSLTTCK